VFGRLRQRRSLISAQGWSAATTLGLAALLQINAESVGKLANSFRVENASRYLSQGCRCAPTLKLANAFGVDENLLKKRELTDLAHREKPVHDSLGKLFGVGGCETFCTFLTLHSSRVRFISHEIIGSPLLLFVPFRKGNP
jgi:hypothetical protein